MKKKLPPYGKHLEVNPPINLVMIYVGDPEGWDHAKRDQEVGMFNHLVLPRMGDADLYYWPVTGCNIVAIDYTMSDKPEVDRFIKAIGQAGAYALALRQYPEPPVYEYIFGLAEQVVGQ